MNEAQDTTDKPAMEGDDNSGVLGFWVTVSAGAISIGAVILMLLGYGVSLAVEGRFGIPHATVFDSGFELLDLASIVFFQSIPAIGKLLGTWQTYRDAYTQLMPFLVFMWVAWVTAALWGWRRKIYLKPRAEKRTAPSEKERRKSYLVKIAGMLTLISVSPLVSLLGVVIIQIAMVLLSMFPYAGYMAGVAYIDEQVLKPDRCMPLIGLEQRRKPSRESNTASQPVAQCVAVKKDRETVADGRVVFATSKAIVLYRPDGSVKRVPLDDSVIEVVSSLPASDPDKATNQQN